MKKLYTLFFGLMTVSAMAQVPTNFGTNAQDGIIYQTYNLIDHGVVSSVRFQAQNAIPEGQGTWEFYTDNYNFSWRPYFADDTLSAYDAIIDPAIESASARYNSNGGQTGKLPAVQAGYYYTAIIQDGTGDNFMSIIETDFAPVFIDSVYHTPENPTELDDITVTVELENALSLSPGEHVFIRSSVDGYTSSNFLEVSNFSNGVGTVTVPAGIIPAGTTVNYYALVTEEETPVHETIDYFTLFFGNNSGNNYEFTVSSLTGIDESTIEPSILYANGSIGIQNMNDVNTIKLISMDGSLISSTATVGMSSLSLNTDGLASGVYVLDFLGESSRKTMKVLID